MESNNIFLFDIEIDKIELLTPKVEVECIINSNQCI